MKNFKNALMIISLLASGLKSSAQYYDYNIDTKYYDNGSGVPVYSNEVGEQGVTDVSNNLYVAGEFNRDGADPAIHIIKYPSNGSTSVEVTYNFSTTLKEQVIKMFWGRNNQLYVLCRAVSPISDSTGLFVLRYNSSLTLLNAVPAFFPDFSPVKACMDMSTNLYITGTTTNGTATGSLEIMKLNSALSLQNTYNYYYSNATDSIVEEPKDILFNSADNNVYVAGRAYDSLTLRSAAILIKVNSSLLYQWKVAPALSSGANVFNSIAAYNGEIYATGSAGTTNVWRLIKYTAAQGSYVTRSDYYQSGYSCSGLKITVAGAHGIYVVGYCKSDSLNQYKAIVRKWQNSSLNAPLNLCSETMSGASQINDAVSVTYGGTSYSTFITGSKYVGGIGNSSNMFFLQVDSIASQGGVSFRDSILSHGAGGNKIVLRSTAFNTVVSVIGYQDKSSNFAPHDYKCFTRTYSTYIQRLSEDALTEEAATVLTVYPNPTSGIINIKNTEFIKKVSAFDMQGKTVINKEFSDETFGQQVDLTFLPKGIYFVRVNDGKTQKIVKN